MLLIIVMMSLLLIVVLFLTANARLCVNFTNMLSAIIICLTSNRAPETDAAVAMPGLLTGSPEHMDYSVSLSKSFDAFLICTCF